MLGGWLNRIGWEVGGDDYFDPEIDALLAEHVAETGCLGTVIDDFEGVLCCHYCGAEL